VDFFWMLHDAGGAELKRSETFATKEDAEAWMGAQWESLLAEGAESVTLFEGDDEHYKMGLRAR
jgi:hypothetical protein